MPARFKPLLLALGYLLLCAALIYPAFERPMISEGANWVRGSIFGSSLRLTQHWLLHGLCLPLFGENLWGYRLPAAALHVVNGLLVYWLFLMLGARSTSTSIGRFGARLAAVLFCFYGVKTVMFLSALAYQLVTFFSLLCCVLALLFFQKRKLALWIGVVLCYWLALLSHSYALALPLFVGLLEIGRRRGASSIRGLALRYGAMLAGLAGVMTWRFSDLVEHGGASLLESGSLRAALLSFPRYCWLVLARLAPDGATVSSALGAAEVAGLLLLAGLCWLAVRSIRKGEPGPAWTVALFLVAWNGLGYLQELSAPDSFLLYWRYYFNVAGTTVALAFVAAWLLGRASSRVPLLAGGGAQTVLLVVTAVALLACIPTYRQRVVRLLTGEVAPAGQRLWGDMAAAAACSRMIPATREQARAGKDLRCRDLASVDLSGLGLSGADLRGSRLTAARLPRVKLDRARLGGCSLTLADLMEADLSAADLSGARLTWAFLPDARLPGARLNGARLAWAVLARAALSRADLSGADLRQAVLHQARLPGAHLRGARLMWANLRDADLRGADLRGADLGGADLRGTRLDGARLRGVTLFGRPLAAAGPDDLLKALDRPPGSTPQRDSGAWRWQQNFQ